MSLASGGDSSFASTNNTFINGSKVNLNSGSSATTPKVVPPIPLVAHTDTLFDTEKGYLPAPGKLISITSRTPAHAPWADANLGVDVHTSLSASTELPSAPNNAVSNALDAAQANATDIPNPSSAVSATVPL